MIRKNTGIWLIIIVNIWGIILSIGISQICRLVRDTDVNDKITENNELIGYWGESIINFIDENYVSAVKKDEFEDDSTIAGEDKDRDFCTITETTDRVLANKFLIGHCYWKGIGIDDLPLYGEFIRCEGYKVYMIVKDNNLVNVNNLYIALNGNGEMYRLDNSYIYENCLQIAYDL